MEWVRCEEIGRGSYASVSRAEITGNRHSVGVPPVVALKTAMLGCEESLRSEKRMLERIGECERVIRCFGDGVTKESGQFGECYSLVLELASGGTLSDEIRRCGGGGGLPEMEIRRHTKAVLEGLKTIHERGVVHCDIKPQNILLFEEAKIADFGLAKLSGEELRGFGLRGTTLYMAPESVKSGEYEPPCDVWALGCVVSEMGCGRVPWVKTVHDMNLYTLLRRIVGAEGEDELPDIPTSLSEEGKDFLRKIFVRDPSERWTAAMLLYHPFVAIPIDFDFDFQQRSCCDFYNEQQPALVHHIGVV